MTCIVGYKTKNNVYIGGDSAGVAGLDITIRADEKIFKNGEFIFGFTSSFRMGQILRYSFIPPKRKENITDDEYLYGDFIDEVIKVFKKAGYAKVDSNQVEGGVFLFGYKNKLYYVESDFQIGKSIKDYHSVGCGDHYAIGCLYALEDMKLSIEEKIKKSLEVAEEFSTAVRRPFKLIDNSGIIKIL